MTINDALADEFIASTAARIYTSSSHQKAKDNAPACDRFRIVWLLPTRVAVPTYEALYAELLRRYPCADKSTSDASRLWYGNTEAIFPLVNGSAILPWGMVLDAEAKSEAIAAQIAEQRARSAERFANTNPDDLRSQVRDALALIPPRNPGSGNYHECLRVAFAVGSAFPEDEALELIEEWSPRIAGAWHPENIVGKGNGSITIGSLFSIAKQYGYRLPSKDPIATFGAKPRTITRDEWIEKFGASELCEQLNRARRRSVGALNFLKRKRAESVAKHSPIAIEPDVTQTAIELYDRRNDGRLAWELTPGQIPTMQEWIDRGRPTLEFTNIDDRPDWWISLAESGEFAGVIASDDTGMGKSDSAGKVGAIVATGSTKFGRAIYASGDHRNPSTESVEQAQDMPTRHNGLTIDRTRQTPSGNPFIVRPKAGQQTDITANCSKADVFAKAQSLGHTLRGGVKSPYCQSCDHFSSCSSSGFIALRSIVTSPEYGAKFLRADLSQIQKYRDDDLVMIEEADASIAATKSLSITVPQLALEMQALELATVSRCDISPSDALYAQTVARAVRDSLLSLLATTQPEYGFTHADVVKALPTRDTLTELLFAAQWTHWLNASSPFDVPSVDEVARVVNRILTPDFDQLFGAGESTETHLNRLDSLTPNGIGKVLGVILGDRFTDLSLNGQLVITRRDRRAANSIPSAGFAVLLTATSGDRRRLCKLAGLDPDRVPSIRVQKPDYSNLTIQIIQGVGSCGRKRRDESPYAAKQRIDFLLDHLNPDAHIDYMGKADRYWFRDNRGSNEFKAMKHIAAVGLPTPNLGAVSAEWHALTGHAVEPTDRTGGYGAFIRSKIAAEILQGVGRGRSQWRPDEQITVSLIGDGFIGYQKEIAEQFPGATINVIDVIDICPIAATKGEQTARAIVNNIVSFARNGETITREKLAAVTGHSNPSKAIKDRFGVGFGELKQAVTFVLEALNTKVTVDWDSIPEQLHSLLQHFFSLSDSLKDEDPDAAAHMILMAIEEARADFGDADTLTALASFPIAHFEPLLSALGRVPIAAGS